MKAKTFAIISLIAVLALTLSGPATVSVGAGQALLSRPLPSPAVRERGRG
jgi:hypothetical protein